MFSDVMKPFGVVCPLQASSVSSDSICNNRTLTRLMGFRARDLLGALVVAGILRRGSGPIKRRPGDVLAGWIVFRGDVSWRLQSLWDSSVLSPTSIFNHLR